MANRLNNLFVIDKRLFVYLFFCYLLMYAIECVTHEGGHYIAARALGHRHPRMHYKSTDTGTNAVQEEYRYFRRKYKDSINNRRPFPEQARYAEVSTQYEKIWESMKAQHFTREHAILAAAGPLETVLTGLVGTLVILFTRARFRSAARLAIWQWLAVFASLFWLVPFVGFLAHCMLLFVPDYADTSSDVYRVCLHFGLSQMTVFSVMGILGGIGVIITFRLVPHSQRFTLILAIITGGPLGYLLWNYAGPMLLP